MWLQGWSDKHEGEMTSKPCEPSSIEPNLKASVPLVNKQIGLKMYTSLCHFDARYNNEGKHVTCPADKVWHPYSCTTRRDTFNPQNSH
jgi:hypothetical protein